VFGVKLAREHKLWTPKRKRDEDTDLESPYPRCYAIIHFVPRFLSEKKNIKIDNKFAITNMVPKPDLIEYLQKKGHNNLEFGPPHTRDANQRTSFECSVYIDPVLEDVKRVIIDITEKTIKKKLHLSQK